MTDRKAPPRKAKAPNGKTIKQGGPQVMTANRLLDGLTVYLDPAGAWTRDLAEAWILDGDTARETAETAAAKAVAGRLVVGPYLFPVRPEAAGPEALSVRERLRAAGRPSIPVPGLDAGFAVAAE